MGKNKIVHFKLNNSEHNNLISAKLQNNDNLSLSNSADFLGLKLDSKLNFCDHIDKVCSKVSTGAFALRRIRKHCNLEAAKIAYFGYVQSILA